jgi:GTP-binding protein Era
MSEFRSGFVGILGRPNVGKSTLLNRLCGEKLAITSSKPQTTRNRILGVLHGEGHQLVFIDTPGMHETDRAINRYMQSVISSVVGDVDVLLYMVDATREHGREDELALGMLSEAGDTPVILCVNKVDKAGEEAAAERIRQTSALFEFKSAHVVSAMRGSGVDELVAALKEMMPEGVPYFPEDMVTDQPLGFRLSEIIREKLFEQTREEIPYSIGVLVEDMTTDDKGTMEISANIYVEKESQKGIVIGKRGALLKKIGTASRIEMEGRLGHKVYLELWVKVKKGWTDRESLLRQLGYS